MTERVFGACVRNCAGVRQRVCPSGRKVRVSFGTFTQASYPEAFVSLATRFFCRRTGSVYFSPPGLFRTLTRPSRLKTRPERVVVQVSPAATAVPPPPFPLPPSAGLDPLLRPEPLQSKHSQSPRPAWSSSPTRRNKPGPDAPSSALMVPTGAASSSAKELKKFNNKPKKTALVQDLLVPPVQAQLEQKPHRYRRLEVRSVCSTSVNEFSPKQLQAVCVSAMRLEIEKKTAGYNIIPTPKSRTAHRTEKLYSDWLPLLSVFQSCLLIG
ncbi:uncharacterized protein LOC115420889 [Sphaeramia orbicularis]|uniref:uncharacterized protein LOC115420889 n=1 Tax=Sphaeramia orbicularis TaxID=375764 RepID=UPI00117EDF6A|nr:uncharacterized protein LOC115420889 [Sphaeramia orbicularis]